MGFDPKHSLNIESTDSRYVKTIDCLKPWDTFLTGDGFSLDQGPKGQGMETLLALSASGNECIRVAAAGGIVFRSKNIRDETHPLFYPPYFEIDPKALKAAEDVQKVNKTFFNTVTKRHGGKYVRFSSF